MENQNNDNIYNILLIGETGTGKSSLGNFIIGEEAFEVSEDPESCTTDTIRKMSKIDPQIAIVDTPGLQDSQGRDKVHYDQMVKIITEMKYLHLVCIILNFTNPRFTQSIQYMIKFLCNLFPKNFAKHVAIIFTHYDHDYQMRINKKKNIDPRTIAQKKYVPLIMKLISDVTNEEEFKSPPVYFMDSYVEDDNSKKNLYQLISLAKLIRQPIEDIRNNCDVRFKKEEPETDERYKDVYEGDEIVTYIETYQRTKFTDYNDKVTHSDWKFINRRFYTSRQIPRKEKKDDSSKEYFDIIKQVKDIKSKDNNKGKIRTGNGDYKEGICKKSKNIDCREFSCKMDGKAFKNVEKVFDEYFSGTIVGFEIIENWKDGTNGSWEINDILLGHNLKAKFTSRKFRGQNFDLKVYSMDEPKDDSNSYDDDW